MIRLKDLLKEAKQVGTIYHFTTLGGLQSILESDVLRAQRDYISFTRNKSYYPWSTTVKISVDGDKLSNHYKIEPYHDSEKLISGSDEAEERVMKKQIQGISKYVINIEINTRKFKEFDKSLWKQGYYEFIQNTNKKHIPISISLNN
jgi:hypothetical protein